MKERSKRIEKHRHSFRNIERVIDKSIPFLLILLAIVIILDNPLWTLFSLDEFEIEVVIFDTIILLFLLADLSFKWMHVRNVKTFVKHYWIEIIAVFPFYLLFRVYAVAVEFARAGEEAQRILHEAFLARETVLLKEARFFQQSEKIVREARPFTRLLRTVARFFRILAFRLDSAYHNVVKASFRHR